MHGFRFQLSVFYSFIKGDESSVSPLLKIIYVLYMYLSCRFYGCLRLFFQVTVLHFLPENAALLGGGHTYVVVPLLREIVATG